MKKLMIAAAIVCAAVVANAASIKWSVQGITAPTEGSAAAAYLLDGSKYAQFTALTTAAELATFVANNSLSTGSIVSGRTGTNASGTATGYSGGDTANVFAVLFNNSSVGSATYYAYSAAETVTIPGSGDLNWAKSFSTQTTGWKAIPEPTSGLLLLLGMAGLALRRKQK